MKSKLHLKLLVTILTLTTNIKASDWQEKSSISISNNDIVYSSEVFDVEIINKDLVYVSTRDTIWLTNDLGDSWDCLEVPDSIGYITDLEITRKKKLWLATDVGLYGYNSYSRSWVLVNNSKFTAICFVNDSIGYGGKYNPSLNCHSLYRTNNKGTTWNVVISRAHSFEEIHFFGDRYGYAIANSIGSSNKGHLYKTDNFGYSWSNVSLPSSINGQSVNYEYFKTIHLKDFDNIYLGGDHLLKSDDLGVSWSEIYDKTFFDKGNFLVNDIFMINDSIGYYSTYSSSSKLRKISNFEYEMYSPEIGTSSGYIKFDYSLSDGFGIAVSESGKCWLNKQEFDLNKNSPYISNDSIFIKMDRWQVKSQTLFIENRNNDLIYVDSIVGSNLLSVGLAKDYILYPNEKIYFNIEISPKKSGIYYDTLKIFCNSMTTPQCVDIFFDVNNIRYSFNDSLLICDGDSIFWRNQFYKELGTYKEIYTTKMGYDSVYSLFLDVNKINTDIVVDGDKLIANENDCNYQWLMCPSFKNINLENSQTFSPSTSGYYSVEISKSGCIDTADCIYFEVVNSYLSENNMEEYLFYPNPVSDYLTIDASVEVFTLSNLNGYTIDIDVSKNNTVFVGSLPKGIYLMNYRVKGFYKSKILIKK